jgi:H/ACA ribonucleoprotein complex subunit 4
MEESLPFEKIKREIFIKKDSATNWDYGQNPQKRSVEELISYGIINLNKPTGPTSHQVSDYVQRILNIDKAGHSGTLDPGVTGVLPIALGKATRIVQTLLKSGKEYIGLMHLHKKLDDELVYNSAEGVIGKIKQLPPIRSAVKRELRTREIYYLKILEINDKDILFKIGSEAGFYVRKFCHDFGLKLKIQAHMTQLIRTKVAMFSYKSWKTLHDLKDGYEFYKMGDEKYIREVILPIEKAVEHLPKIWVHDSAISTLCHGADLSIPGISKYNNFSKDEIIAIMTLKNELICLGNSLIDDEYIKKNYKGKAVKVSKVFMEREMYPKFDRITELN